MAEMLQANLSVEEDVVQATIAVHLKTLAEVRIAQKDLHKRNLYGYSIALYLHTQSIYLHKRNLHRY